MYDSLVKWSEVFVIYDNNNSLVKWSIRLVI